MANTLAYYDAATITAVKSFIVQAPGGIFNCDTFAVAPSIINDNSKHVLLNCRDKEKVCVGDRPLSERVGTRENVCEKEREHVCKTDFETERLCEKN